MEVELPGGQIAEFPDDMPHEQIQSVLQQHFAPKKSTQEDKNQSFEMIKNKYPKMPEFMIKALMPIATKMAESPKDTSRGSGTGAFLRSAIRTPLEGAENFASLIGLPVNKNGEWPELIAESESDKSHPFAQLFGSLAGFAPLGAGSIGALRSIPAWGNIASRSAPSLLRRAPVMATEGALLGSVFSPEGNRGEGAAIGGALGIGGATLPSIGKSFSALKSRISSLRNLDRLKEQGKITDEQYQEALAQEKALQELSKEQGLGDDINKMESILPYLESEASGLKEELSQIPKQDLTNRLPFPSGEELVPESESLLKSTEKKLAEQEKKISTMLGEGNAHRKRVASKLNPILEKRQAEIGKGYDEYIENLKDKNVVLSNPRDAKAITADIHKLLQKGDLKSPELIKLTDELSTAGKEDTMPADKFVSAYRSLRSMSQKTRSSAYGKSPQEFDRLIEAADSMDKDVARMEEVINKGLGGENLKQLKSLNHRYATEVAPLFKNDFFLHMQAKSKAPKNMMEHLTNEPYIKSKNPNKATGTQILNEIIRSDPELLQNVIGERFASNPKNIHQWDEIAQEFIQHMPELKKEISIYKSLHESKSKNIKNIEQAREKSSLLKKESKRINEGFEQDKKIQNERLKKEKELSDLQEKITNLRRNIPELKKKANAREISLKKKIELEQQISKTEKDIKALKNRAGILAIGLTGAGASYFGLQRPQKTP